MQSVNGSATRRSVNTAILTFLCEGDQKLLSVTPSETLCGAAAFKINELEGVQRDFVNIIKDNLYFSAMN